MDKATSAPVPATPRPIRRLHPQEISTYVVASFDDAANLVGPCSIRTRFAVLGAVANAVPGLMGRDQEFEHRRTFLAWAGLAMLQELRRQTHTAWGSGPIGYAVAQPRRTSEQPSRRRRKQRSQVPRRPRRLMLNMLDSTLLIPQYRYLHFAAELAALQKDLRHDVFEQEVLLPTRALRDAVTTALADARFMAGPNAIMPDRQEAPTPSRRAAKILVTDNTIPEILDYYGIGGSRRHAAGRAYGLVPWRLHQVLDRLAVARTLDLTKLTWMEGRYLLAPPALS